VKVTVALRNLRQTSWISPFNSCKIRGYSGTRPTNPDTALSGNTLLFECTGNATSFPSPSGGVLTANAIAADASADNTGTCSFVRIFQSDGTTALVDLSVGVGSGECQLSTLSIIAGGNVSISSLILTDPVGS
jgi:hypothetical protein